MPGKRYEAQDKRVQKMTRDGLTEENLHSGERKRISSRHRMPHLCGMSQMPQ